MREVSSSPHHALRGGDDYGPVRYVASALTVIGLLAFVLSYELRRPSGTVDTPAIELQPVRTTQSRSVSVPKARSDRPARIVTRQTARRVRAQLEHRALTASDRADRARRQASGPRDRRDGASVPVVAPVRAGDRADSRVADDGNRSPAQPARPAPVVQASVGAGTEDPVSSEVEGSDDDGDAPVDVSEADEDVDVDGGSD
jgi:hypothetical protein